MAGGGDRDAMVAPSSDNSSDSSLSMPVSEGGLCHTLTTLSLRITPTLAKALLSLISLLNGVSIPLRPPLAQTQTNLSPAPADARFSRSFSQLDLLTARHPCNIFAHDLTPPLRGRRACHWRDISAGGIHTGDRESMSEVARERENTKVCAGSQRHQASVITATTLAHADTPPPPPTHPLTHSLPHPG